MVKSTQERWDRFPIAEQILKSIQEQELASPLPIQAKALKASLLDNKHVFGAAKTGSGKTLAYAIPVVNHIIKDELSCPKDGKKKKRLSLSSIVLVPTRELAVQVKDEFDKICNHTTIKSCCIIGGISQDKQLRTLSKLRPNIIIATPGRLYDIIQSDDSDYLNFQSVAGIRSLVIDEADRMVQRGHFEELVSIVDIVKESRKSNSNQAPYRVYLFSATLTFLHELPERFKTSGLNEDRQKKSKPKKVIDPKEHTRKNKIRKILALLGIERMDTRIIDLNDEIAYGRPGSDQLSEMKINCLPREKDLYLYYYLTQNPHSRTLVFCNSKDCLRRVSNVLRYLGYTTLKLHADMDQKKRLSSLERFRRDSNTILVATDVAARGLDIKDLESVVHYQVPRTCESYIHRSGRTARVFGKGTSITLCEPKEAPFYRRLCNNINSGKDLVNYDIDLDLKALLKDRVALAQQCDELEHKIRKTKSCTSWFAKAAKECDIELDDDDIRRLSGKGKDKQEKLEEDARDKRLLDRLHKQLKTLLKKPLVSKRSMLKASVIRLNEDIEDQ